MCKQLGEWVRFFLLIAFFIVMSGCIESPLDGQLGFGSSLSSDLTDFINLSEPARVDVTLENNFFEISYVTVSGTIHSAEIRINSGAWQYLPGNGSAFLINLALNDLIELRVDGDDNSQAAFSLYSIGENPHLVARVTGTVSEVLDSDPDPFTMTDLTNQTVSTLVQSNIVTITGINTSVSISAPGTEIRINGGAWVAAATNPTISNGETFQLRVNTSASNSTTDDYTVTIGGQSDTWSVTTEAAAADTTPDAITFNNLFDQPINTWAASNVVAISGVSEPVTVSAPNLEIRINGGPWVSWMTTPQVDNGDTLQIRAMSSTNYYDTDNYAFTVGSSAFLWSVRTVGQTINLPSVTVSRGTLNALGSSFSLPGPFSSTGCVNVGGSLNFDTPFNSAIASFGFGFRNGSLIAFSLCDGISYRMEFDTKSFGGTDGLNTITYENNGLTVIQPVNVVP